MANPSAYAVIGCAAAAGALGTGDFVGGVAARSRNAFQVAATVEVVELGLLLAVVIAFRPTLPPPSSIVLGAGAGLAGAIGLASLYRGLATGSMALVAAISGVGSVAIPILVGIIFLGSVPSVLQGVGIACAIGATFAATLMPGIPMRGTSIGYGLVAAVGFGTYLLLINAAAAWGVWVFWPAVFLRSCSWAP